MKDEDEDKPEGEALTQYQSRLAALTGTENVRVPKRFIDKHGNVILPPQAIYLLDSAGDVHESSDTSGFLKATNYGIGSGTIRRVQAQFAKSATGTTGGVTVTPGTDDVIYFMYGSVIIGGTHAGAASPLYAGISTGTTSAALHQVHLYDATADVDEIFYVPALGEANTGPGVTSGVYHEFQTMIPSTSLITADEGVSQAPRYLVEYQTMASTELFDVSLYFYSVNNVAVIAAPIAGTFT